MTFQIDSGVPIPPARGGNPRRGERTKSPVAVALDSLDVTDSFLMEQHADYQKSRGLFTKYRDRSFVTRKTGDGWRIWRIA